MMREIDAIKKRISVRAYKDEKISDDTILMLKEKVDELNEESGLHMVLVCKESDNPISLSSSMFSGDVTTCLALIGDKSDLTGEKLGYYGEKFLIYAVSLGLSTCWVAGTYDKKSVPIDIKDDERLWSIITLGYGLSKTPLKQKLIRNSIRSRDRKIEEFFEGDYESLPSYVKSGIEAIKIGPSAVNGQPANLFYSDDKLYIHIFKKVNLMTLIDLGIAKYHFEVGAMEEGINGRFNFGNPGEFILEESLSKKMVPLSNEVKLDVKKYIEENLLDDYKKFDFSMPLEAGGSAKVELFEEAMCDACYSLDPISNAKESASLGAIKKTDNYIGSSLRKESLSEYLKKLDETFSVALMNVIDKKGLKDSDVYNKALVSRQVFNNLINGKVKNPTKQTACALILALELDINESEDLLKRAGYFLSNSSKFDIIIRYCIEHKIYRIAYVNELLLDNDQVILGAK